MLLENTKRSKKKSKETLRQMKIKNDPKSMRQSESNPRREIYSNIGLPQETNKKNSKKTIYPYN